ncbi:MAG: ATP-binding protein [Rhizobium sp.]|nr:ATP-binding protein [Rhizobium sp.]
MIVEANWGNFRAKFNAQEQKAFEWLCSLLFYKEQRHPTGALRYFNQPGIEAEPVIVGADVIGWQAKFIGTDLASYKTKLIQAINTAKTQHPTLTQLYFYVNVDFGRSKKPGVKDPPYKTAIEEHAKAKGVAITWKTASFFETPFVCETNANIASHFFMLGASVIDFVQEITRHTEAILEPIRSAIVVEGKSIKIDRRALVTRLKDTLSKSTLVIVSGEAGVGKTAVVKDLYDEVKDTTPFFMFKATEFNVSHVNQLFKDYGAFTFSDFVHEHEEFAEKYVVIDSAEKLSDLDRPKAFQEFLSTLRSSRWKVIFTTRLSYLDDLKYAFIELYNAPFELLNIPGLTQEELVELSVANEFSLPENERLRKFLQNPFYLNEYLRIDVTGNQNTSYAEFREAIWNCQITRSSYQKDNIHRKREECFLEIARKRAASGHFFVTVEGHDEALRQLVTDEIIKFDSRAGGYFITHDIYEEWALERTIERSFRGMSDYGHFYQEIGDALAIRRAFRGWLSEKLGANNGDAARLIEATVSNDAIPGHWRDEAVVAALLSNYSGAFIQYFEQKLLEPPPRVVEQGQSFSAASTFSDRYAYEKSLLGRILFLVRIACKEVDQALLSALENLKDSQIGFSSIMTKPKGSGWTSVVDFLNLNKAKIGLLYMHVILPILDDWNRYTKKGETTKAATEIALYYLDDLTKDGEFPYNSRSEVGEQLIRVILAGSWEVKEQLGEIFRGVIASEEISRRSRYHELVTTALSSIDKSAIVAESLPKEIIGLASVFWPYTPPERNGWGSDYRNDIEQYFDLAPDHHDYYPASALQTPTLRLLQVAPKETVDFIVAFTNRSIEYFAKTDLGQREVEEVDVYLAPSERPLKQYISHRLWMMYRGRQSAPTLLESIHMALEKWLLTAARQVSAEVIESWCLYLIKNSRSASITAIVASVALAESSKLFNVALVLFRTKDFFFFDLARMQFDESARSHYSIVYDPVGLFTEERFQTCDDSHRRSSLEDLALQYQLFRSDNADEELARRRQEAIWAIFDEFYARLPDQASEAVDDKSWRLSLARMDRRKMKISAETKDDGILLTFNPQIDSDLQKHSEESQARITEEMQYVPLNLWASYRWQGNEGEYSKYAQYESDYKRVVADIKAVCEGLKSDETEDQRFRLFYRSIPPVSCAVLMRDFADKLDQTEREFCRDVLLGYASLPLIGPYEYQIGDGLDAAINALPLLIQPFPEYRDDVKGTLLLTLLDRNSVGMSQRFADHAVSAILNMLWKINPQDANALFLGYLLLQPVYEKLCETILHENRTKGTYGFHHFTAIQRFAAEYEQEIAQVLRNELTPDKLPPPVGANVDALVTAFSLLPLGTKELHHKAFAIELTEMMAKRVKRTRGHGEEQVDFSTRHRFLQKFAHFVLSADRADIQAYVQPLVDNFKTIDYTEDIIQEFVSAEDKLNKYDVFWEVWELFYPCILALCQRSAYFHSSSTVHNYLLAWPWWRKGAKEWHSLKDREKGFFQRVARDIGSHPAVLYSLAKLLNEIASGFASDGIFWVSEIIERGINHADEKLETNTIYYLENFVRGFVLRNRHKVRTTPQIKAAILVILNFLIEQGSVTAYLVREDVL